MSNFVVTVFLQWVQSWTLYYFSCVENNLLQELQSLVNLALFSVSAESDRAVCSLRDLLARHVAVVTQTAAAFKMMVTGSDHGER